jgi:uncharacterized membrane protein YfcA
MSVLLAAAALGLAAGVLSGMFGVGGGVLFVPTLALVLGLTQLGAQATSLAAMIPVVLLGAWRQHRYGNLRWRHAVVVGVASVVGVAAGVAVAHSLADETLRRLFALLLIATAAQLALSERGS